MSEAESMAAELEILSLDVSLEHLTRATGVCH